MPELADLVLWGIPLVGLVSAVVSLIKWIWEGYNEKVVTIIGAVLTGLGAIFIFSLADLLVLLPALEVWGLCSFTLVTTRLSVAFASRFRRYAQHSLRCKPSGAWTSLATDAARRGPTHRVRRLSWAKTRPNPEVGIWGWCGPVPYHPVVA